MSNKRESIMKATLIVSLLVIMCKLLGFAREAIIASYYGANSNTDAFFFAQGMPASIFPSICNSISTAFTALYIQKQVEDENGKAVNYASAMLLATSCLGLLLSFVGVIAAPVLVPIFAPGFKGAQLILAIHLTRLIMGAFFLTMLQYMLSAILNSNKLFYASQVANIANNIVVIVVTVFLGKGNSMDVLTCSVIGGLVINVAILFICCRKFVAFRGAVSNINKNETMDLLKLSMPIILGNGVVQINTIVDKALGSTLPAGSLSSLTYAGTLNALVTGVFIASLSTVLYPTLTENAASGKVKLFSQTLSNSLGMLTIFLTFVSFMVYNESGLIIKVVFERGSFSSDNTSITSLVLSVYAFMYVFSGIREVLTRAFFSLQDTKTPMINGAIGVAFNILFSIVFVKLFGIIGIPLGTVLSNLIISALLIVSAKRKIKELTILPYIKSLGKQILAGLIMTGTMFMLDKYIVINHALIQLVVDSAIALCVYCFILLILKCSDFVMIISIIKEKGFKK